MKRLRIKYEGRLKVVKDNHRLDTLCNRLTPYEQIYRSEDFDRWRNFELLVYNLSTGRQELSLAATTTSRGMGYGGIRGDNRGVNELPPSNDETRIFFTSDFKIQNKVFKKSITQLCK